MRENTSFKKAFTLAETMITLTVIGVLAAIIIPVVSQNINDKAFTDSKDIFSKKLTEAMSQMRTADKMSGYFTNQEFLDEFQKYMRTVRTCDLAHLTDCFSSTIYATDGEEVDVAAKLKTGKDFGKSTYTSDLVGVMFANGTSAILAYDPACVQQSPFVTADPTSCLSILYDINGFQKPNKAGRDIMMFNVSQLGSSGIDIGGTMFTIPVKVASMTPADCTAQAGALGISDCCTAGYCGGSGDFWAAAVQECGGVANLPTPAQLATLADDLYGVSPSMTFLDFTNAAINASKNSEYGLPAGDYMIWSSEGSYGDINGNPGTNFAGMRVFTSVNTVRYASGKTSAGPYTMCKQ